MVNLISLIRSAALSADGLAESLSPPDMDTGKSIKITWIRAARKVKEKLIEEWKNAKEITSIILR